MVVTIFNVSVSFVNASSSAVEKTAKLPLKTGEADPPLKLVSKKR